jgi:hypothetical protein
VPHKLLSPPPWFNQVLKDLYARSHPGLSANHSKYCQIYNTTIGRESCLIYEKDIILAYMIVTVEERRSLAFTWAEDSQKSTSWHINCYTKTRLAPACLVGLSNRAITKSNISHSGDIYDTKSAPTTVVLVLIISLKSIWTEFSQQFLLTVPYRRLHRTWVRQKTQRGICI